MSSESMDNLSNQIRDLYNGASAEERQYIQEQLRDLQNDIFTDWEVLFNIAMGPLRWSLAQIAVDLNIFNMLDSASSPLSRQELVEKTGAAPKLLGYLLHGLASFGFVKETSKDHFTANRVSKTFVNSHVEGSMVHISELHVPVARVFPQYLKDHKYQDINDITDLPFHKALNTHLEPFEYLKTNPVQMKALGHVMVVDAVEHWVSSYPVVEMVGSFAPAPESALLVDIGGSFGEHSIAFKSKFSKLPGRVVVQDLPSTLAHLPNPRPEGIEFHEYDFFTPQPIRGAKFYYLRHVLHDWPDDECVRILKNIIPAMSSDSLILIDEVVLPETRVPWQVSAMVLSMMACLGGTERSRPHWATLLERSGLKIADVHRYDDTRFQSIVVAVPK